MPAGVVLGSVYAALRALLLADATVDSLLARDKRDPSLPGIYSDGAVPAGAIRPYLTIGAGTQVDAHTLGAPDSDRYGYTCSVQVKAVGQGAGEDEGLAIMDAVGGVLYDGTDLAGGSPGHFPGYAVAFVTEFTLQPPLISIDAGVTIRSWPAILGIYVHD